MQDDFEMIKFLYEMSGKGLDALKKDLEKGVLSRVNLSLHPNFDFTGLFFAATPIREEEDGNYRWMVFKPEYKYKDNKFINIKTKKVLSKAKIEKSLSDSSKNQ